MFTSVGLILGYMLIIEELYLLQSLAESARFLSIICIYIFCSDKNALFFLFQVKFVCFKT